MTRMISALARPRMLAIATLLTATFAAAQAFAQDATPATPPPIPPVGGSLGYFGERGQFVVSSDLDFTLQRNSFSMGGGSNTVFAISPALDYFVSSNFSVGGRLHLGYASTSADGGGDVDITTFGLGARAGYNIVLNNVFTWWINGGLLYFRDSIDAGALGDASGNRFQLQVFAPFLWHPASHFFIGVGPAFATDLVSTYGGEDAAKQTSFGLLSTIGGYWGGL
jgi:hypothetical protein